MRLKLISILAASVALTTSCSRHETMTQVPTMLLPGAKNLSNNQVKKSNHKSW